MVKRKRIWDNFIEIGEVRKSANIKYVIAAATREGFRYINIREFYLRKRDNVWCPGRDGITIPMVVLLDGGKERITPYKDLMGTLRKAAECAISMELMNEENAVWMEKKEPVNEN